MKRLTLFRHAKTEPDSASGEDFDRRLAERGRADAARMGEEIRMLGLGFDLVLASPAVRAVETAELAGLPARHDQRIYDASAGELLAIVQETANDVDRLMLIGHNPGFERLASRLAGGPVDMPTGSVVEIELPIDKWNAAASGRLIRFLTPSELA